MKNKQYYLCSQTFMDKYLPNVFSAPLDRYGDTVYIAEVDFKKANEQYEQADKESDESWDDYWCQEITLPTISVSDFTLEDAKEWGLFGWISNNTGGTTTRNVCAVIGGICLVTKQTPIELFNTLNFD
jgi:hypothetical protein